MKKLRLYCGPTQEQPTEAFEMLNELSEESGYFYAGLYGDNGGDPDGNTWLPSDAGDIPADVAQKVVAARLGEMVEVRMADDEAMINFLGLYLPADLDDLDDDYAERMRDRAEERQLAWAHYGAYGAADSHWVFVKPEEK